MATAARLLYSIFLPASVGYLFAACFSLSGGKMNVFERLFLGFGIGTGILTVEMFLLGWLRIPFNLFSVSLLPILLGSVLSYLLFRSASPRSWWKSFRPINNFKERIAIQKRTPGVSLLVLLLFLWIIAKLFFLTYESLLLPVHTWDDMTHWSSGAKFIFHEQGFSLNPSDEYYFAKGYFKNPWYPLNVTLTQVWVSLCMNEAHEVYLKVWNLIYFAGIIGVLFFSTKNETTLVTASLVSFFVASTPLLSYHALTAYADLPLGYYALGALVCFKKYMDRAGNDHSGGDTGTLVLAGAFAALTIWTKAEGILFAIAFSLALILFFLQGRIPLRRMIGYLIPVTVVALPWYVFLYGLSAETSPAQMNIGGNIMARGLHLEVLPVIGKQLVFSANFNLIFPFFALMTAFGYKTILKTELKFLYLPLLSLASMFLYIYICTENYRWVMNLTAINRNLLAFLPMIYYVAALTAARLLKAHQE